MSDILVTGQQAYFNDDAKFFKDVYIYGTLYYDFTSFKDPIVFNDIDAKNGYFRGDVYIEGNASVGILTVRKRLDVGIGGTVIRAIADLDGLPFLTGKVGIGSTAPSQSLDVVGNAIISQNVGIGTTVPLQSLDVIGTAIISNKVGIGGTTIPQQRLDVSGSVKIDANIYDSVNSPGKNGYQLARDDVGIRWIPLIAEPVPGVPGIATDGVFVLDEGVPLYP
jgi:hypothetical protein